MGPFDAGLLIAVIGVTTPILLAATGEVVSERAGVLNVGLEGMMLAGAFAAFYTAWKFDSLLLGVIAGIVAGCFFAAIMALLVVEGKADQIVAGIGINVLAVGATSFAYEQIFSGRQAATVKTMEGLAIPGLSSLGGVGRALFDAPPITYVAFLMVPAVWFLLSRTHWGLSIRAAGEVPEAADTAGVSVRGIRWGGTLFAGGMAGLGGAYLSIVDLGLFRQEMTAGRGFLALAAVIFGRWRAGGVLLACLLFGGTDALQLRLQTSPSVPVQVWVLIGLVGLAFAVYSIASRRRRSVPAGREWVVGSIALVAGAALALISPSWSVPTQLWLALPFLLALIALAGAGSRIRMPAALNIPFRRGEA
jgi:ABC-type uncharacterized transport system permease subunit